MFNEVLAFELYYGYTIDMKTAISLPDSLYEDAETTAKNLGIPRSQLYALALEEFIQHHQRDWITQKLNEVYERGEKVGEGLGQIAALESLRELTKNDSW